MADTQTHAGASAPGQVLADVRVYAARAFAATPMPRLRPWKYTNLAGRNERRP